MADEADPAQEDERRRALVRRVVVAGRAAAGSGTQFAAQLQRLGISKDGQPYSESAISNWINGRTMPPADVLLAAARLADISIDAGLAAEATDPGSGPKSDDLQELRRDLDSFRTTLIDLYGRLGFPVPPHLLDESASPAAANERSA